MTSHDDPTSPLPASRAVAEGFVARFAAGQRVADRYVVDRFIARGGMGEVYEAHDTELRERVAIKAIRPEIAKDERAIERFKREILLSRKVTHPNVCRIFDIAVHRDGDHPPVILLTMELLEGTTLAERLRNGGRLPASAAMPIAEQIASALFAAHRVGVIHRDLKSANVMLVKEAGGGERAVVTDFGLARTGSATAAADSTATAADMVVGTPAYMAPEQVEGRPATEAADVYALGIVLYEMVTGVTPFRGDSPLATAVKRLSENPPPPRRLVPDLDPRWESVILRCLAREPADRFASAEDVAAALRGERVRLAPRRSTMAIAAGVAAVLALASALTYRSWPARAPASAPPVADTKVGPVGPPRRSVAVLGFKNLSGRADVSWLSTALSEMLSTELAAGERLRSIPGESVARMKVDLALADAESFGKESLGRIRAHLGSDVVVLGSYLALGGDGQVRLDVRVQDAVAGETIAAVAETGTVSGIIELVGRTGVRLRQALGVGELSPAQEGAVAGARPSGVEAARLYAEGLARLRLFDALGARERLEAAIAKGPDFAPAHAALAQAWSVLGYDAKAREAARRAFDLSVDLPREDRLFIEGRYREMAREWDAAIASYRALSGFFPDNLDYGLRLASALTQSGGGKKALEVIGSLKQQPAGAADFRIDIAEAEAAESIADFKREEAAAARGIAAARARGARLAVARGLLSRAWALRNLGRGDEAAAASVESRAIYEATGDRAGAARAINSAGTVRYVRGDYEGAKKLYREAEAIFREIGDRRGTAASLNNRGVALRDQGRFDEARRAYEESLALRREIGDLRGVAGSINNIALILWQKGDLAGAAKMYEEAIAAFDAANDRSGKALALTNQASIQAARADLAGARRSYELALATQRETGNRQGEATTLITLGALLKSTGDITAAKARLEEADALATAIENKTLGGYAAWQLGEIAVARDDLTAARAHHQRALDLWTAVSEGSTPLARVALAGVDLEEGRPAAGEAAVREAAATFARSQAADAEIASLEMLVRVLLAQKKLPEARRVLARLQARAAKNEDRSIRLAIAVTGARVDGAEGRADAARKALAAAEEESTRLGLHGIALEVRLVLGEIDLAAGLPDARSRLLAVRRDALAADHRLLARKAEELLR